MKSKIKRKIIRSALLTAALSFSCAMASCAANETKIAFEKNEYELYSGEKIYALCNKDDVVYRVLTPLVSGVELDENSGEIVFDESVPDGYQFLAYAEAEGKRCNPVVCTLKQRAKKAEYTILSEQEYYTDGNLVKIAVSPAAYAISYALEKEVKGVSINSVTGELSIEETVEDGTTCSVVASSKGGVSQSFTVKLKTKNLISAKHDTQIREKNSNAKTSFLLDFSKSGFAEFTGVSLDGKYASESEYVYDSERNAVVLKGSFFQGLAAGEYRLYVHTRLHSVPLTVKIADKIVTTPEEIQEINATVSSLAGYYVLDADIDLASYLSKTGDGYDGGKGWRPIGVYLDKPSPYNVEYAFTGTFDGNGHVIKNLRINRGGDATGFNCGFFGYAKAGAVIKNLGLDGGDVSGNSYCGALVGVSFASISNVWSTCKVTATKNETYKWIGGLVGRNAGTIKDSFVVAEIDGATETGVIAGNNQGSVENCYGVVSGLVTSLTGVGSALGSEIFKSRESLIERGIFLNGEAWSYTAGKLPTLKIRDYAYYPRKIEITANKDYLIFGEELTIETLVFPLEYTATPEYRVEGKGVTIDENGKIDTSNAKCLQFTVRAFLQDCVAEKTFFLYETPQSVLIENEETVLFAGTETILLGKVTGDYARQDVTYKITEGAYGVALKDGVLYVSKYAKDGTVKIQAMQSGLVSQEKAFEIRALKDFSGNTHVFKKGEEQSLSFIVAGGVKKVSVNGKEVTCEINGGNVLFTENAVKMLGIGSHEVVIFTKDVAYKAYIKICDQTISTKEEFLSINASAETLSKYYVLMADLDFSDEKVKAIGKYDAPYQPFSGVFDGNGHTVKNVSIESNTNENEKNYYNLGLFGYVTGTICNLRLENVRIRGTNFVGGLCGALGKGGVIENCQVISADVEASAVSNISGTIAGRNNGSILYCSYGGEFTPIGQRQTDGYEEGLENI